MFISSLPGKTENKELEAEFLSATANHNRAWIRLASVLKSDTPWSS
jgi:hypothetical protein